MQEPRRVAPADVARRLRAETKLLLVCAYSNDVGFRKFPIEGAIALSELDARLPALARDTEIVFYCRCPRDKTSLEVARRYLASGHVHSAVLAGGVEAWLRAGFKLANRS